ncbi:MAG: sulfite exporter TauE/SafE family protein [Bacteroidetes bacterium]|nr:MAG: sulfite exporter TauE/SafE family protein [Bacteroidota bacterium]
MEWYIIVGIIAVGFLAGFINTLAGGGSFIALSFLIFIGLPANVANGTNRIALFFQNIVATRSFKRQKALNLKQGLWFSIPIIIGSIVGAQFAVTINESVLQKIIGVLLIVMFFLILYKPDKWVKGQAGLVQAKPGLIQIIISFFIGIYGGFIQAGVGFFLLAGLVLSAGFDLVKANALKVFIILLYTPFAISIFIFNDQINYKIGLILAIGNMAGAAVASRFATQKGAKFVRYIVLVVLLFAAVKLLGIFELITNY